MNVHLKNYVAEAQKAGLTDKQIFKNLLDAGWLEHEISKHFKARRRGVAVVCAIFGVFALTAGGILVWPYAKAFLAPGALWKSYQQNSRPAVYHANISLTFTGNDTNKYGLSVAGPAYLNFSNPSAADSSGQISYAYLVPEKNFSISGNVKFIYSNHTLYASSNDNAVAQALLTQIDPSGQARWLKFDTVKFSRYVASEATSTTLQNILYENFFPSINDFQSVGILTDARYMGIEKISGLRSVHFSNSVDNNALTEAIVSYYDEKMRSQNVPEPDQSAFNEKIRTLLRQYKITNTESWIGITDGRLHKWVFDAEKEGDKVAHGEIVFYDYGKTDNISQPADSADAVEYLFRQYQSVKDTYGK